MGWERVGVGRGCRWNEQGCTGASFALLSHSLSRHQFLVLLALPSAPSVGTSLEMGWGGAKRASGIHKAMVHCSLLSPVA